MKANHSPFWEAIIMVIIGLPIYNLIPQWPLALLTHAIFSGLYVVLLLKYGRASALQMGFFVFILAVGAAVLIVGFQNSQPKTYDGQPQRAASTCSALYALKSCPDGAQLLSS